MSASESFTPRAFCRSADRAVLGGVCAGVADYFGLNLRVLRVMALIAFFVAMPAAIIAYIAIVLLVPARASNDFESSHRQRAPRHTRKDRRAERKRARREARKNPNRATAEAAAQVRRKCQSLEQRLANLEKYITSSRYQLDEEFRRL